MLCKIGVVSIGLLSRVLMREIESMNLPANFIFSETMLAPGMALPENLETADVLLSSGYLAQNLKAITDKPVITIEPSIYDILSAYSKAIDYDPHPVIIFPLKKNTPKIDRIRNILAVDIISNWYDEVDAIDHMIKTYTAHGCRCIIGSGLVCEKAKEAGVQSVFIYPKESLRAFIKLAYDMACSMCERAVENQRMSAVIANAKNGIVFTDDAGRIFICNPTAQEIFRKSEREILGTRIFDHFENEELIRGVYTQSKPLNNLIFPFGEEKYIVAAVPITRKGSLSNVMLTIENIKSIQNQEYHIRSSLARRGFTAHKHFSDYRSDSHAFQALVRTAKKFALSGENIIILGETGSGKEVLAQSIHNYSPRAGRPFVAVNCSAISESLLESELFGYDEGAFTGAKKGGKQGYFEMAHTGTIFLDEVSELSMALQSKLLRVIQEKQVIHVGGNRVIDLDVRVIAATNQDLWKLVQQKKFREDLYYRLVVLELDLPPLRSRAEDIYPLFLDFIVRQDAAAADELEKISAQVSSLLNSYPWPGNIRELENFSKMLLATCDAHEPSDVMFRRIRREIEKKKVKIAGGPVRNEEEAVPSRESGLPGFPERPECSADSEEQRIRRAMLAANGNYTKAAALLGIDRVTLWRKRKKMEAGAPAGTGGAEIGKNHPPGH